MRWPSLFLLVLSALLIAADQNHLKAIAGSNDSSFVMSPFRNMSTLKDWVFRRNFTGSEAHRTPSDARETPSKAIMNRNGPVIIRPASHLASLIPRVPSPESVDTILNQLEKSKRGQLINSSFRNDTDRNLFVARNGFVNAAIEAYSHHHHLVIRPDDIWLAILTQLSSYINANAEKLRGSFVAHSGKKELKIVYEGGTRFDVDWTDFAQRIGLLIQENVVDPELREWILPAFSTTREEDTVVANIVMMASMQSYFKYVCAIVCGLPSVTLEGEVADYELILRRLDKLESYGAEPTRFAHLLRPVIRRFILSFEKPEDQEVVDFWNHIFTSWNMGSGPTYYSGWITAFTFWDSAGKLVTDKVQRWADKDLPPLSYDGVTYHRIESEDVPPGFCTVPVTIDQYGTVYEAEMLAGSIGWHATSSGSQTANGKLGLDTVQPKAEWFIYHVGGNDGSSV